MKVDWSSLPIPEDDGEADHLVNSTFASISLLSTDDKTITLSHLPGKTVVYIYPRTGQPGKLNPDGWDRIPGKYLILRHALNQVLVDVLHNHVHSVIMQKSFTIWELIIYLA